MKINITEEKFKAYEKVRLSGQTNMFMVKAVSDLSWKLSKIRLKKEEIFEIMRIYGKLKVKFDEEHHLRLEELNHGKLN